MLCKTLSMPRNSRISRLVCCDASRVLRSISLANGKSFFSGMLSICKSVSSSLLSLAATVTDLSNANGVLSRLKTLFIIFNPQNFYLNVFAAKNSPVALLVRDCQCLSASIKSNSILPVSEFFFILNWSRSAKPESPVTPWYLCNETILSRFSFCFSLSVDVASAVSGIVNYVLSTLLVSGVV